MLVISVRICGVELCFAAINISLNLDFAVKTDVGT
jgi:hypothetical protein